MKKFRFTLRAVSVVRAHRERLAREAMAVATAQRAAAEARLAAAEAAVRALEEAMTAARSRPTRPMDAVAAAEAHRRERANVELARRQAAAAAVEAERLRQACIEANKQVRIIERLEQNALNAHRALCLRAEQAEFDEMAGHRSSRKTHAS
jgi:hypothetical protein